MPRRTSGCAANSRARTPFGVGVEGAAPGYPAAAAAQFLTQSCGKADGSAPELWPSRDLVGNESITVWHIGGYASVGSAAPGTSDARLGIRPSSRGLDESQSGRWDAGF